MIVLLKPVLLISGLTKSWLAKRCQAAALAGLLASGLVVLAAGMAPAAENWLTGEALQQALTQTAAVTWGNISARSAVESFAKAQRVAVMLDRRIDPDQKIELAFQDVPLQEALARIASRLRMGVTMLGPVAYFGPKATVERLRTVVALRSDEATHLPLATRLHWTQAKAWKWEKLSAPRELIADLGQENQVQIEGLEKISTDLWAAADLPPLTLPERLMVVLAQFDLTYEPSADGTSLRIVTMPDKPVIERSYAVTGTPQDVANQLRQMKMLADAQIDIAGKKVVVRGRQEDQDVVNDLLAGHTAHKTSVAEGKKVYTLRVEVAVGELLEALSKQMRVEIQIDKPAIAAAGISLEKKVQVDVKEVSADALLHAVLDPVGLTYVQHDKAIEVKPK